MRIHAAALVLALLATAAEAGRLGLRRELWARSQTSAVSRAASLAARADIAAGAVARAESGKGCPLPQPCDCHCHCPEVVFAIPLPTLPPPPCPLCLLQTGQRESDGALAVETAAAAESSMSASGAVDTSGAVDAVEHLQHAAFTTPAPCTIGAQAAAMMGSGPPPIPDWRDAPCPESPPCNCYCHCREPPEERIGFNGNLRPMGGSNGPAL
jgi:hypothetical protein|mmetsp:Transcript_30235/g.89787  ORF Transcript_30235/g.89787 Transcript_30235/m.89787 type:complete len:212 (-) Transcript_30235:156-791(-)